MDITLGTHVLTAIVFGLVFAFLRILIEGLPSPFPWRHWLGEAVVLAGLAYIILFGVVRV
jgi:hypothetical protein